MRDYKNGKIYKIIYKKGDNQIIYLDYTTTTLYNRFISLKHYKGTILTFLREQNIKLELITCTNNKEDLKSKYKTFVDLHMKNKDDNTIVLYTQHSGYNREKKIVDKLIHCECGSVLKYTSIPAHEVNLKHINYIANKWQTKNLSTSLTVVF